MKAQEINNYGGQLQKSIGSGFNGASTANEVIKGIDLTGKIAMVSGGNTIPDPGNKTLLLPG